MCNVLHIFIHIPDISKYLQVQDNYVTFWYLQQHLLPVPKTDNNMISAITAVNFQLGWSLFALDDCLIVQEEKYTSHLLYKMYHGKEMYINSFSTWMYNFYSQLYKDRCKYSTKMKGKSLIMVIGVSIINLSYITEKVWRIWKEQNMKITVSKILTNCRVINYFANYILVSPTLLKYSIGHIGTRRKKNAMKELLPRAKANRIHAIRGDFIYVTQDSWIIGIHLCVKTLTRNRVRNRQEDCPIEQKLSGICISFNISARHEN